MIRAVFGGTFDPVHAGHAAIVEAIRAAGFADLLHVVPARRSPLKEESSAPPEHRLAMVELAFAARDDVVVEPLEVRRGAPSFTIDTLRTLAARHPADEWRLVVGADQLEIFDRWRDPEEILRSAGLIVLARRTGDPRRIGERLGIPADRCFVLGEFDEPVSATEIRAMLARGEDPGAKLAPAVREYIRSHELYRT